MLKRLSPRTLFSLTSSSSPAQCSTSSPSHLTYRHSHNHPDSRNVRVSVWWDFQNCRTPYGANGSQVAGAITAAVESSGIKGPIHITAIGNMFRLARSNEAVFDTEAITFRHIHDVGSIADDLTRDLLYWASQTPPPAHLFLITGDTRCAMILHRLRMENYNILLASEQPVHSVLSSAASIMWDWCEDEDEGYLTRRRYFNQPPNRSWYGHYEGPLEDPAIDRPSLSWYIYPGKPDDHEVFSQDSFWRDFQTFINTDLGSLIMVESRTMENLAYYLKKYGPSVLKTMTDCDVFRMVDILRRSGWYGRYLEKKWVVESPNLISPFKLTSSAGITSSGDAQGSSD